MFCTDGDDGVKVDEEEEVREYRVKCLNNLAAAQLKLEQYEEALSTSQDVLTLEQNNVKALYRTGKVRSPLPCYKQHTPVQGGLSWAWLCCGISLFSAVILVSSGFAYNKNNNHFSAPVRQG